MFFYKEININLFPLGRLFAWSNDVAFKSVKLTTAVRWCDLHESSTIMHTMFWQKYAEHLCTLHVCKVTT